MKEYDRVELINDRQEYLDAGVKKGDKGTILGENRWVIVWYILMAKTFKTPMEFGKRLKLMWA